jgi:serine protease Do
METKETVQEEDIPWERLDDAAPQETPAEVPPASVGEPPQGAPPDPSTTEPAGTWSGRRRPGRAKRIVAGAAAALVMVAGGYGIRAISAPDARVAAATSTSSATIATAASAQTGDLSTLVQRAERAVVRISSQVTRGATIFAPAQTGEAVGTGFVVASNGVILTNFHVVEGAQRITVTMNDGRTFTARVDNADSAGDLAVLKIDATGLSTLALGNSSQALAGQSVVAIGYALGLQGSPTVTTGIVSSTGRTIQVQDDGAPSGPVVRTYRNVLQISAAINAGNSGGPLLDLQGRVIGINTAGSSSAQNIGFAIPIDRAMALLASAQ